MLNAKYWVELLLLERVGRPFSFVATDSPAADHSDSPAADHSGAPPDVYVQGLTSSKGRVVVAINTKSTQHEVALAGGKGKQAFTVDLVSGSGPAREHSLTADTVALQPFATMFVVWL